MTNKKVGFSIKYFGDNNFNVEIYPLDNLNWFIKNGSEDSRRLQEAN